MVLLQLLSIPTDHNFSDYLSCGVEGFLFPLKDFSCDFFSYFTLEEIENFRKEKKEVPCFVIINKMIENKEIEKLRKTMVALDQMKIDGIYFYDLAILQIKKEESLMVPLSFFQTHMATNSETLNFYVGQGVSGAFLSNEITLEEIKQISEHSLCSFTGLLVGYPTVAMSKRKLLSNLSMKSPLDIKEPVSGQNYLVLEQGEGTSFLYGKRLNASSVYDSLREVLTYGVIKQDDLDHDTYCEVIRNFKNFNQERIDALIGRNRGFFFRKSIYRVKK